mmetsp:Transcript_9352/g.16384  ORF Transcript_9352/g.16384 Transcript_9352/m.16384 type:complete len:94 (-) Transcript_9352:2621-2902(-)
MLYFTRSYKTEGLISPRKAPLELAAYAFSAARQTDRAQKRTGVPTLQATAWELQGTLPASKSGGYDRMPKQPESGPRWSVQVSNAVSEVAQEK